MTVIVVTFFTSSIAACQTVYKLDGKIGGQYPIVIELVHYENGLFSGQYAYKSTLRKSGDKKCSWLMINPDNKAPTAQWTICDCRSKSVETWYNVKFDGKRLTVQMKNDKGKSYDVAATVTQQTKEYAPLTQYFRQHIGELVDEFNVFSYLPIKCRFIYMMGINNYADLKEIYQAHGDIEYLRGMYFGSGFKAHQCCDPATVWAYDTHNNAFYVWIRQDGSDRWWSETGDIPIKFRNLVSECF